MAAINDHADQDSVVAQHVSQLYLTPSGYQKDATSQVVFPLKRSHFDAVGVAKAFPVVFRHLRCDAGSLIM